MDLNIYKLAAQVHGFYDIPLLDNDKEKPEYFDLFTWGESRKPFTSLKAGILKEEMFDNLDKKIAYLQGVFEDLEEGAGIIKGENYIQFANSNNKVERCKKWLNEVSREFCSQVVFRFESAILKHTIEYHYPICHRIDIRSSVVKFIQNYKLNK